MDFTGGTAFGSIAALLLRWRLVKRHDLKQLRRNCPHYHTNSVTYTTYYAKVCTDCGKSWNEPKRKFD